MRFYAIVLEVTVSFKRKHLHSGRKLCCWPLFIYFPGSLYFVVFVGRVCFAQSCHSEKQLGKRAPALVHPSVTLALHGRRWGFQFVSGISGSNGLIRLSLTYILYVVSCVHNLEKNIQKAALCPSVVPHRWGNEN